MLIHDYTVTQYRCSYTVTTGFPKLSIQVPEMKLSLLWTCYINGTLSVFFSVPLCEQTDFIQQNNSCQNVTIIPECIFEIHLCLYYYYYLFYHKYILHCDTWYCMGQTILHGSGGCGGHCNNLSNHQATGYNVM